MTDLPPELWRHILSYCDAAARGFARLISRDVRAIVARCAFPRKLSRDASTRWFREPEFQTRVAATIDHPERDLYVDVFDDTPVNDTQRVYSIGAAAELHIIAFSGDMPRLALRGSITHLVLCGNQFHASHLDERVARCAAISIRNAMWFTTRLELPPQLCVFHMASHGSFGTLAALEHMARCSFEHDVLVTVANIVVQQWTMRLSTFRRLLVDRETVPIGFQITMMYNGSQVICIHIASNTIIPGECIRPLCIHYDIMHSNQ